MVGEFSNHVVIDPVVFIYTPTAPQPVVRDNNGAKYTENITLTMRLHRIRWACYSPEPNPLDSFVSYHKKTVYTRLIVHARQIIKFMIFCANTFAVFIFGNFVCAVSPEQFANLFHTVVYHFLCDFVPVFYWFGVAFL